MRDKIHPQFFTEAKVICACGHTFTVGATRPEIHVEICSQCHPFYTGKQKFIDAGGQLEKFRKRLDRVKKARAPGEAKRAKTPPSGAKADAKPPQRVKSPNPASRA